MRSAENRFTINRANGSVKSIPSSEIKKAVDDDNDDVIHNSTIQTKNFMFHCFQIIIYLYLVLGGWLLKNLLLQMMLAVECERYYLANEQAVAACALRMGLKKGKT